MNLISMVWACDGCTKNHITCPNAARSSLSISTLSHTVRGRPNFALFWLQSWALQFKICSYGPAYNIYLPLGIIHCPIFNRKGLEISFRWKKKLTKQFGGREYPIYTIFFSLTTVFKMFNFFPGYSNILFSTSLLLHCRHILENFHHLGVLYVS